MASTALHIPSRTPRRLCALALCAAAMAAGCGKHVEAPALSAAAIEAEAARLEETVQALPLDAAKAEYFFPAEYTAAKESWTAATTGLATDATPATLEQLHEAATLYTSLHQRLNRIAWISTFGGEGRDETSSVRALPGGGYLLAGSTTSFGAGQRDAFLVHIDADGNEVARFTFGGAENDSAASAATWPDGGYVIAGRSGSFRDWTGDAYIVRADEEGNELWSETFGAAGTDVAELVFVRDDALLVIGNTFKGGGGKNIFVLHLDPDGHLTRETILPGEKDDWVNAGFALPDGSILLAGGRGTLNVPDIEFLIMKLDPGGTVLWEQTYDEAGHAAAGLTGIAAATDGTIFAVGQVKLTEQSPEDAVIIAVEADGALRWREFIRGDHDETAGGVAAAEDGGAVVAVTTQSYGAGGSDILLAKYDAKGAELWIRTLGSDQDESARAIAPAPDGGFVIAGERGSFLEGIQDIYVVKTNADGFSWLGRPFGTAELHEIPQTPQPATRRHQELPEIAIGKDAPPIHAAEWLNVPDRLRAILKPGDEVVAEMLGARLLVIEFWATWCVPCRVTVPHLNALQAEYGDRGVLFISLTDETRDEAPIDEFMRETGMQTIVGIGSPLGEDYGAHVIPSAYLIDRYGKLRWQGHPMAGLDQAIADALETTE
jgi:thiol-disulfide isomerase/thioredoxin